MTRPTIEELEERVREGFCPNWPHPGVGGCRYCAGAEMVGALAALTDLTARAREAELLLHGEPPSDEDVAYFRKLHGGSTP